MALTQIGPWESKEREVPLSLEEAKAKRIAREEYRKCFFTEEVVFRALLDLNEDKGGEFYDHSGDLDEEVRADNTMWLTVYEACNERINGCKELGVIKSSSDKGRGMEGVGDTYDAQVERSEPEGKWEESGLAKFSQLDTGQRAPNCDCPMKVKILSWNVRGANDSSKRKVIKTFIRNQRVDLICLQETKIHSMSDSIARSLGSGRFLDWKAANAEGLREIPERRKWGYLGFYGSVWPFSKVERDALWEEFGAIRGMWEDPWCLGGDFNITLFPRERSSQRRISSAMRKFAEIVDDLGLPRPASDHFPITLVGGGIRRGPTPFRFENIWLKVEGFKDLVHSWWQGIDVRGSASYKLAIKMKEIKQKLKVWNREVFGKLECNKSAALQQVEFWDRKENERILTVEETELKKEAKENYRKWVIMEETHWRQLSREIWLKEEDRKHGEGIANAFKICSQKIRGWKADIGRLQFDQISQQEAENLERPFTEDEIHVALMEMNGDKAPSPDGFTMDFWQSCWDFIKEEILEMFKDFYEHSSFLKSLNNTFLVLIPKKSGAKDLGDFRPISLLGGLYNLLAKVLANRLKKSSWKGGLYLSECLSASGLRINLAKSEIIPVGEVVEMEELAVELGCRVGSLPSQYLGLPLGPPIERLICGMGWKRESGGD
ncbi:Transposon TX1 uncharacterized 149 kDa protein [Vitis vinifera]|uniref:Transposon TX1 uncharacterized 149 kDa protein n=1 Tax=Vitis vinifera TaxID=29760 RepID=A0A438H4T9_VITVI|nr:Transposon TX1 uncharacterized 149 kDa protein [Vitis vinifera]